MSDTSFSETVEQIKADALTQDTLVGVACIVVGVLFSAYIWRLYNRLDLLRHDRAHAMVLFTPFFFMVVWAGPIQLFSRYTRVALPAWLTFGHPVAFGGVMPNVCDNISWAIYPQTGGWPCVSSCWKKWLADMVGSDEWHYPCNPGPEPTLFLLGMAFASGYLAYIIWLLCTARKRAPKCKEGKSAIERV